MLEVRREGRRVRAVADRIDELRVRPDPTDAGDARHGRVAERDGEADGIGVGHLRGARRAALAAFRLDLLLVARLDDVRRPDHLPGDTHRPADERDPGPFRAARDGEVGEPWTFHRRPVRLEEEPSYRRANRPADRGAKRPEEAPNGGASEPEGELRHLLDPGEAVGEAHLRPPGTVDWMLDDGRDERVGVQDALRREDPEVHWIAAPGEVNDVPGLGRG